MAGVIVALEGLVVLAAIFLGVRMGGIGWGCGASSAPEY